MVPTNSNVFFAQFMNMWEKPILTSVSLIEIQSVDLFQIEAYTCNYMYLGNAWLLPICFLDNQKHLLLLLHSKLGFKL